MLDGLADKGSVVRESAQYAIDVIFTLLPMEAISTSLLSTLLEYLQRPQTKWQGKIGALVLVAKMAKKATGKGEESRIMAEVLGARLAEIIPVVESGMHDLKGEVCF